MRWDDAPVVDRLDAMVDQRLASAALVVRNGVRELISTPGRTVRTERSNGVAVSTVSGLTRSSPNQPPHLQSGDLYRSYIYEVYPGEGRARVGSLARHARPLEFGAPSRNLAARPHLRRTLRERVPAVLSAMRGEGRGNAQRRPSTYATGNN